MKRSLCAPGDSIYLGAVSLEVLRAFFFFFFSRCAVHAVFLRDVRVYRALEVFFFVGFLCYVLGDANVI